MSKSGILTLGILLGLALGTFIQCSPDTPSLAALKNGEGTYFDMPEFKHDMVLAAYCDTVPADAYVHGSVLSGLSSFQRNAIAFTALQRYRIFISGNTDQPI